MPKNITRRSPIWILLALLALAAGAGLTVSGALAGSVVGKPISAAVQAPQKAVGNAIASHPNPDQAPPGHDVNSARRVTAPDAVDAYAYLVYITGTTRIT